MNKTVFTSYFLILMLETKSTSDNKSSLEIWKINSKGLKSIQLQKSSRLPQFFRQQVTSLILLLCNAVVTPKSSVAYGDCLFRAQERGLRSATFHGIQLPTRLSSLCQARRWSCSKKNSIKHGIGSHCNRREITSNASQARSNRALIEHHVHANQRASLLFFCPGCNAAKHLLQFYSNVSKNLGSRLVSSKI